MSLTQLRLRKKRYNAETDNSKGVLVVDTEARSLFVGGVELIPDFDGSTADNDGKHGLVPAPLSADKDKYLNADGTWKEVADFVGAHTESSYTIDITGDFTDYVTATDADAFHNRFPSGAALSNVTWSGSANSLFQLYHIDDSNDAAISQFGWDTSHVYYDYNYHSYQVLINNIKQNGNIYPFGTANINKRVFIDWMNTLGLSGADFVYPTASSTQFAKSYRITFDGSTYTLYDYTHNVQLATGFAIEDTGVVLKTEPLTLCGFVPDSPFEFNIDYSKGDYADFVETPISNVTITEYQGWDDSYVGSVTLTPEQFATLDVDWENVHVCYFVYDSTNSKWLIYLVESYEDTRLCDAGVTMVDTQTQESILNSAIDGTETDLAQYYADNYISVLPNISNFASAPLFIAVPASGGSVVVPGTHGLVPAPQPGDRDKALFGDGTWRSAGGSADFSFESGSAVADTPNSTLTITTSASQRTYTDYTVDNTLPSSDTIQLVLDVQNNFENYLLLRNDTGATLAVTIGTPTYIGGTLTEVVSSDSGISVDDGKIIEISYIVVGTAIVITNSGAMSSAALV